MRVYMLPDGTRLSASDQFQLGNQKYPPGWLAQAPTDELKELGIDFVDEPDPVAAAPEPRDLALAALDATDATALRCFKAGIAFPPEWQQYTEALRAIVRAKEGDLPDRPPFPKGS
jgi:hypothetical protein